MQRPSWPVETSAVGPVVTSVVGTSTAGSVATSGSSAEGRRIAAAMAETWATSETEAGGIEAGAIGVAVAAAAAADKNQSTG